MHNENSKLDNNTSATTTTTTNNNNNDTTNNSVNATFVDKTREFKSDTAKTLLSILDGNEQEKSTFDFNNDSNPINHHHHQGLNSLIHILKWS